MSKKPNDNTLTKPLYGNCKVYDPYGIHIFNSGRRKCQWYLDRGLANIIQEEPLIIGLNFEPKGPGNANDFFHLAERKNICVVCGSAEHLTRHHIVPYCYRKHFPPELKRHSSHDIVAVCRSCHEQYEEEADKFKRQLVEEYSVEVQPYYLVDKYLQRVCLSASALLSHQEEIPASRQEKLLAFVQDYYGRDEITTEDLDKAAQIEYNTRRPDYKPEGQLIVECLKNLDEVEVFVKRWRKHFLLLTEPKHMPKHWNPERPLEKTRKT